MSITLKEFEDSIKRILFSKLKKCAEYENHKLTGKELKRKWKLEKRESQTIFCRFQISELFY